MRKITKRAAVIATAVVVAVGGAGAAFATWSLNSSDDASTVAGSASRLEVSGLQIVGALVPGSPAAVKFNAKNNNSFAVVVSKVSFSEVHTSNESACPTNNLVAPDLPTSVGIATGATSAFNLAGALKLKPNADDGCQGATFAFKVNLTVASDSSV